MFQPLWDSLGENHREKIVTELWCFIVRTTQLGVFLQIALSQEHETGIFSWVDLSHQQNITKLTLTLDMKNCPKQTVAFLLGVKYFYAMMIHDFLKLKKIHWGLIAHHVAVMCSLITLTEPALRTYVSTGYVFNILAWIILGGQCMAAESPAFIYYHLYPNSEVGQFACYTWILASRSLIITVFFLLIPYYKIQNNFYKMSTTMFRVIFFFASVNATSELFVLWRDIMMCKRKYVALRNTKTTKKED